MAGAPCTCFVVDTDRRWSDRHAGAAQPAGRVGSRRVPQRGGLHFFRIDAPGPTGCVFGGETEAAEVDLNLEAGQMWHFFCGEAFSGNVRQLLEQLDGGRIAAWRVFDSRESMRHALHETGTTG
jgi:hypothetical protein